MSGGGDGESVRAQQYPMLLLLNKASEINTTEQPESMRNREVRTRVRIQDQMFASRLTVSY